MQDYCCGWCKTGHNDWYTLIVYWAIPNGLWILFPTIIGYIFVSELTTTVKVAARVQGANAAPIPSSSPASSNGGEAKTENQTDSANPYLVGHSQLPAWAQDNAWIVKGYRRPGGEELPESLRRFDHGTVYKCWRSVWAYWHNETGKCSGDLPVVLRIRTESLTMVPRCFETVNIHTHLWGAVFSLGLSGSHLLQHLNLLPSFIRPLSHHPIFYPPSLTFTTATGKILRLASASYSSPPSTHFSQPSAIAPATSFLGRATSLLSSLSSSPSTVASAASDLTVRGPDAFDVAGFTVFFIGAIICLGFSSTYHAIQCHSYTVSKRFNKLDYVGIVVMIVGSFLPALHYGFYCHPHLQLFYSVSISVLGALAMYVVLAPSYATPAYRPYRTAIFVLLGLFAVVPVAHFVAMYGYRTITETMGLRFLILSGVLYVVGAGLYAARVPERFAPGRFDMLGASHQIFHVLILAAAAAHYVSIRRAYAFWHTVEAIGTDAGRQGVCAALQR